MRATMWKKYLSTSCWEPSAGYSIQAPSNPRMFAGYGRQRGWEREISGNELPDNEDGFVELSEEEVRQLELPKEWIA